LLTAGWSNPDLLGQNISNAVPWLLSPDCGQTLREFVDNSHPDAAWAILVIGLVFLYLSLTSSRRWRQRKITPSAAAG
jgi:thiosulfate reductase cytochrome b subunit